MGDFGNYLVDVTNCDEGAIGAEDALFLTGYTSKDAQGGYQIAIDAPSQAGKRFLMCTATISKRFIQTKS